MLNERKMSTGAPQQTILPNLVRSLKRDPDRRSTVDLQIIYNFLRPLQCLLDHTDGELLQGVVTKCTYLKKSANDILYCRGELANCWYILISGSVFIDGSMFLPITTFGRRQGGLSRRPNECLILEPSEMIFVEYSQSQPNLQPYLRNPSSCVNSSSGENSNSELSEELDLSGLIESVVDDSSQSGDNSEEEDSIDYEYDFYNEDELNNNFYMKDSVRESLEKDPSERTEHDIAILLEFTQHLNAFNDLTLNVRRQLVSVMVFAVVEKAGTLVLSHGEELDSWSVIIHGAVEVVQYGTQGQVDEGTSSNFDTCQKTYVLSAGDSFGLPPTLSKQYFNGQMRTRTDDCQFVCVTQEDYFRILKQGQDNQTVIKNRENDIVLVTELKPNTSEQIIIRGSIDELTNQLVFMENPSSDPTYVEDFLLTQRIFNPNNHQLLDKLVNWFTDIYLRDRVTRVILLWVNNHFIDFESHEELFQFLIRFQQMLEDTGEMQGQLRLLQIACSAKARQRKIILTRKSRDDLLPFNIMGGGDNGYGIFISHVDEDSKASNSGLRTGDELLELNGATMKNINLSVAFEKIKSSTHLVLTVKCNFLGYYECINNTNSKTNQNTRRVKDSSKILIKQQIVKENMLKRTLAKINFNLNNKKHIADQEIKDEFDELGDEDFCSDEISKLKSIDFPDCVVKVYRSDQSFKYLLINKETTSREVVMLALQEFTGNSNSGGADISSINSRDYALFQVSSNSTHMLKQTRLPDTLDSLAERIPLGGRYYIKRLDSTETLLPDEQIPELVKDTEVNFLQLNPIQLALQSTLDDYSIFRQIEMTEYVDDLFNLKEDTTGNLKKFAELVNRETFWVVSEIVKELNVSKRVQIIKRFIKVAKQVREVRNFNSMFAIVSGLGHSAITRLKNTWDKLNAIRGGKKYLRMFNEMQSLMDPSRNMGKYRTLIAQSSGPQSPMIPFYPVVRKDLTFINLGNSSFIDNLVNFEKMRMIAKEIRNLTQMCAAPFDTHGLPSIAAMNQLTNSHLTTTTGKVNAGTKAKHLKKIKSHDIIKSFGVGQNAIPVLPISHNFTNPKKMYEEAHMIRRVKAYLAELEIISDEDKLQEMSQVCEPNLKLSTQEIFPMPKPSKAEQKLNKEKIMRENSRRSSPTPSTTSSTTSNDSSRNIQLNKKLFGTGSPSSYQKLMSLSERTKLRNQGFNSNLHGGSLSKNNNFDTKSLNSITTIGSANHSITKTNSSASIQSSSKKSQRSNEEEEEDDPLEEHLVSAV